MSAPNRRPSARLLAISCRRSLLLFGALAGPPCSAGTGQRRRGSRWWSRPSGVSVAPRVTPPSASGSTGSCTRSARRDCRGGRAGTSEAGLGLATGWGLALVCVLPLALAAASPFRFRASFAWGWLVADAAFFALAALAEEVAFRGYGFQRFVHAVGPFGAALGFAAYLRHCAVARAGVEPRQHRCFHGARLAAFHGLSAHARHLAELGTQLWLEGQPRPALRARGQRRQQPFARRPGRSDGPLLAHRRRLRPGRKLGTLFCPFRSAARRLPPHPRSGFSIQRSRHRARRHSGRSRCRRARPA